MPDLGRDMLIDPMRLLAPWIPIAPQIYITVRLYVRELQCTQSIHIIVEGCVGMPGGQEACPVGVDENECGRKRVVVVDDITEIGHGFVTFVHRSGQKSG